MHVLTFLLALALAAPARYPQKFCEFFSADDTRVPPAVRQALAAAASKEATDARGRKWTLEQIQSLPGLPIREVTCVVLGKDDSLWLCTPQGAVRRSGEGWEYLAGMRYLTDDRVENILPESPQIVWLRTAGGISRIEYRPMTLEDKARYFEERIRARHDRYGFVAGSELARPGDLSSNRPYPNDNDGLWTAIYIGAEAFRFAVTKDPEARSRARRSLAALMRLEEITGLSGFPARSFIRKGDFRHQDGVWHFTPDGEWEWKGDTSSDELVGHFFAYALYYDLVAEDSEKPAIRAVVDRIASHLIEHGYNLVDVTGRPTTWGKYSLEYFAGEGRGDLALNSMLLLSHLRVAHHITGKQRFLDEYRKLIQMGYARNVARLLETRTELNYSDEELAMLGYYPLSRYERDPALRRTYRRGLEQWWQNCSREKNPLWIYIYNFATGQRVFLDDALWTLARIPMDLVEWTVKNSHRSDVRMASEPDRFRRPQTLTLLPADERPVMKWNGNPFRVDSGNGGRNEDDGAFYLLPYWMGRYHGYLAGP